MPSTEFRHGTASGWKRCTDGPYGKRCSACTEYHRAAQEAWRRSKGVKKSTAKAVAEHGSRSRYRDCTDGPGGTKCAACSEANRVYQRSYMAERRAKIGPKTVRCIVCGLPENERAIVGEALESGLKYPAVADLVPRTSRLWLDAEGDVVSRHRASVRIGTHYRNGHHATWLMASQLMASQVRP